MATRIIKKDSIFIQTKKNFTTSWKLSYLYILKENNKPYFVLFKSDAGFRDCDIPKYRKEKNSNIIVSKSINSRVEAKKILIVSPKLKNVPTNYIFSVEFGITSKFKISVFSIFELCQWVSTINTLVDEVQKNITFSFQSMKLTFLRTFRKTKSKVPNGIPDPKKTQELEADDLQSEKYYVYRIVSNPPCEIFDNLYHAMVEFDAEEMKLVIKRVGHEPIVLKWEYCKIQNYGVKENIFSFETVDTGFTDINGEKIEKVSYMLTVNQQNNLKQTFEKYNVKTPVKSISFEIEKVENPLTEFTSRFETVKSDLIIRNRIDVPAFETQPIEPIALITNDNESEEKQDLKDISSIVILSDPEIHKSLISYLPETSKSSSTIIKNSTTSIKFNSAAIQSTDMALQESSRQNTTPKRFLTEPISSSQTVKNITTYFESLQNTIISNNLYKCMNENGFKIISHVYRKPQTIPCVFIDNFSLSSFDHSV